MRDIAVCPRCKVLVYLGEVSKAETTSIKCPACEKVGLATVIHVAEGTDLRRA